MTVESIVEDRQSFLENEVKTLIGRTIDITFPGATRYSSKKKRINGTIVGLDGGILLIDLRCCMYKLNLARLDGIMLGMEKTEWPYDKGRLANEEAMIKIKKLCDFYNPKQIHT